MHIHRNIIKYMPKYARFNFMCDLEPFSEIGSHLIYNSMWSLTYYSLLHECNIP